MVNISRKFYYTSQRLVEGCGGLFQANLGVGYIESEINAADAISKYSKSAIDVCNSKLYRHGANLSIKEMEDRVVIVYQNGEEPTFNGERLLKLANQEENVKKLRTKPKIEDKEEVFITTRAQSKAKKGVPDKNKSENKINCCNTKKFPQTQVKNLIKKLIRYREEFVTMGYKTPKLINVSDRMNQLYGKFYTIESLITFFYYLVRMEKSRSIKMGERSLDSFVSVFQEAMIQMFRNAQRAYPPNVEGSTFNEDLQLHIVQQRLDEGSRKRIFNNLFLVCLSDKDPLRIKLIRWKHVITAPLEVHGHRSQKGTIANLVKGPFGSIWKGMMMDVKSYCRCCGICSSLRPLKAICSMGRTLLRDSGKKYGFSHCTIDPLAPVKVSWGRALRSVIPCIMQCLTTKAIFLGLMKDMTTAALFGVVAKCSLRFNGAVQHLYSDKGSNLKQENLFGKGNGVFIHQKISHTQLRNLSESSTVAVKRLLHQLAGGMKTKNLFDFEFFLEVIAAEHNKTPFLESGNP